MPAIGTMATAIDGLLLDVPDSKFVAHEHIRIYPANSPVSLNQTWTNVSDLDESRSRPDSSTASQATNPASTCASTCRIPPPNPGLSSSFIQLTGLEGQRTNNGS